MKNKAKYYLIDTPPPTISGPAKPGKCGLHIGHIFSYTQADIIANYQKYIGKNLLYPFAIDNNGIPTQKSARSIGITQSQKIIQFSIERSKDYFETFNEAGIQFSDNEYHTYSESSIRIAHKAFEFLKSKGIIYKADTEYMWCPKQKCSISQSELNDEGIIERSGELPEIRKGTGWFINIKDYIPQIKEKINEIDWKPERFKQNALNWADNIQWDWSISRERHYGIPIPGEENLTLDTWFISSLSPQLAWNSFNGDESLDIPIFDMRYQGHDIIRTWAFYTITMSYFLNDQIPWKTLMITGHTLDGEGNKEAKSSGNATDPKPLIHQYKPSGIRWWATSSTLGNDIKLDGSKMKMGWRIQNKLNNAEKFIQMQIDNDWTGEDESLMTEYLGWKSDILKHFEDYELDKASDMIYKFFWNTFCDIWIEDSKKKPTSLTLQRIIADFKPIIDIIL
jgi:valyl-tRNA synthetase